jgi:hypothetical protein
MVIKRVRQRLVISPSEKKDRLQFIHWLKPVVFLEIFYKVFHYNPPKITPYQHPIKRSASCTIKYDISTICTKIFIMYFGC